MHMRKSNPVLVAAVAAMVVSSSAFAGVVGTKTIAAANHFGRRANGGNTVTTFTPAATGTIRWIGVTGTLTSDNALTWARSLRVQPSGGNVFGVQSLATGPGTPKGQGYFQYSWDMNFTGTINVSAQIAVPGGINAAGALTFEAYSVDSESPTDGVPGLDGHSTLTYTFLDAVPNGGAEFSGALSATDPRFQRAVNFNTDPTGSQVIDVSATGTNVYYDVQPFSVATSGTYAIGMAAGFDTQLLLYEGGFNPATPLANFNDSNDEGRNVLRRAGLPALDVDNDTNGIGRLDRDLVAGVQYYAVMTSYANGQTGDYFTQIAGPGAVTLGLLPEPTTVAALAGGAVIAIRRRRA
jgi:hypothetical protein